MRDTSLVLVSDGNEANQILSRALPEREAKPIETSMFGDHVRGILALVSME